MTTMKETIRTKLHTFTINDVKVPPWPQRIQEFYTFMAMKNLAKQGKYMILLE